MEIIVQGRNLALSDRQRAEATARVEHAARVFGQSLDRADVEVIEEGNPRRSEERFRVEVTTNAAGRILRIEASAATLEAALDDASDRLTRRLRRLKERLIDRGRRPPAPETAPEEPEEAEIVRVKQFVMKPMTVEEATLQMDMLGHSFFFFHNAETDRQSVLYKRRDGRLGLIEPA